MSEVPSLSRLGALRKEVETAELQLTKAQWTLMNAVIARTQWAQTLRPICPACAEARQIQIMDALASPAPHWRCRTCKHNFNWQPEPDPS